MEMWTVYQHKKATDNQIFYIGIAKNGTNRSYSKRNRNRHWHHVVNKHGYNVETVSENCTHAEAVQIEQYLIAYYGRISQNTGCLVNITAGGEGINGFKFSEISREKMSIARTGIKFSEERNAKISAAMKGKKRTFSDEHKAKISAAMKGKTLSEETKAKMRKPHNKRNNG